MCFSFHANSFGYSFSNGDSIPANHNKQWITPAALFTVGSSIAAIPSLRKLETRIYDGFNPKREITHIDDYTQYLPALTVFTLDAAGLKGRTKPQKTIAFVCFGQYHRHGGCSTHEKNHWK